MAAPYCGRHPDPQPSRQREWLTCVRPMMAASGNRSAPAGDTGADPPTPPPEIMPLMRFASVLALLGRPPVERQAHHHRRAGAERRADAHHAAMQFDQRLGDGQAQPRAVMGLGELAFDLLERPAELLQRVARDADAGILDADHHGAARHAAAHRDAAFLGGELDGVGQQIERDLLERAPVGLAGGCRKRSWR